MGVVYLARDLLLGRLVALKTLRRIDSETTATFRREACITARLVHPHLALLFGAETWRGNPILVLEYLPGGTLKEKIGGTAIPPGEVIVWGIALASALEEAHAKNILHRDVKPSNVGFTLCGTPKLLDFGLADLLDPGGARARHGAPGSPQEAGRVEGTAPYLSPEAISGERAQTGFDLWGLAITLYEAVAGRNPFVEPSADETFSRILNESAPDVRDLRPDCPAALANFFRDVLCRKRGSRPRTAREFRLQLERMKGNADTMPA